MKTLDINLIVPSAWHELNHTRAEWLLKLLSSSPDMSPYHIKTIAFLRFSGMQVITKCVSGDEYLFQANGYIFPIDAERFADCVRSAEWVIEPPKHPWRPHRLAWGVPSMPGLQDLPFGKLLQLDNLYAAYLHSLDDRMLRQMGALLVRRRWRPFMRWELLAIFNWYASVKDFFIRRFPNFYGSASSDSDSTLGSGAVSPKALEDSMNAQIRALTKGDVSKEEQILALPCHRALVELDALAKEYYELNAKMKK